MKEIEIIRNREMPGAIKPDNWNGPNFDNIQ